MDFQDGLNFFEHERRRNPDRRKSRSAAPVHERRRLISSRRMKMDRRACLRAHKKIKTRFRLFKKDLLTKWDVLFTENTGAGGVLFHLNEALEIGTVIELYISFPGTTDTLFCKGRVVRVKKVPLSTIHEIAVSFAYTDKTLLRLINQAADRFYSANRAFFRR